MNTCGGQCTPEKSRGATSREMGDHLFHDPLEQKKWSDQIVIYDLKTFEKQWDDDLHIALLWLDWPMEGAQILFAYFQKLHL